MQKNNSRPFNNRVVENPNKINQEIRVQSVRLTGINPSNNEQFMGEVVSTRDALALAQGLDLDLVLINEKAVPPIVRIIDYKKYLYEQKKRKKDVEQNAKKIEVKELRLTPNTDEHDLAFKTKHAINWLTEGNKIKAVVIFKGRSIMYRDRGEKILLQLADALTEHGVPESMPVMDGKNMLMYIKPKK